MPFSIRTDLAMEARELHPSLSGVTEESEEHEGVAVTRIALTTDDAAARLKSARAAMLRWMRPSFPRGRSICSSASAALFQTNFPA